MSNQLVFASKFQGTFFGDKNFNLPVRNRFQTNLLNQSYQILYETDNFAANVIDLLPDAMGQIKPVFSYPDDQITTIIQKLINDLIDHFVYAEKLGRLVGGSVVLVGYDGDLDKPNKLSLPNYFNVLEGGVNGDLTVDAIDVNPESETFRQPLQYSFRHFGIEVPNLNSKVINASRCIQFLGIKPLTRFQQKYYRYWGIPVFNRCFSQLKNLTIADSAIANTLDQLNRIVVEINNYDEMMSTSIGKQRLREKQDNIIYGWKQLKVLILQAGEKISNVSVDYNGYDVALNHVKQMLAGSTDLPFEKLFNTASNSGKGLSGSQSGSKSIDRSSERQWADYVASRQVKDWYPKLSKLIDEWLRFLIPNESEIEKWDLKFPSILIMSESEGAELDLTKAQTAQIYLQNTVIKPEETAKSLAEGLPLSSVIDMDKRQSPADRINTLATQLNVNRTDNDQNNSKPNLEADSILNSSTFHQSIENLSLIDQYKAIGQLNLMSGYAYDCANEKQFILNKLISEEITLDGYFELLNSLYGKLSLTVDDAEKAKQKIKWNGYTIAVQYYPFQYRHGKMLVAGYGYIENLKGSDGMALDCYIGTNLESNKVFIVDQHINGNFDEEKLIIGVNNSSEARDLYLSCMPLEFLGGLREISLSKLNQFAIDIFDNPLENDNQQIQKFEIEPIDYSSESFNINDVFQIIENSGFEIDSLGIEGKDESNNYLWSVRNGLENTTVVIIDGQVTEVKR